MGILNGPRINFWGGIQINVCVANNQNKVGGTPLLDLARARISDVYRGTDDQAIALMRAPGQREGKPYYADGGWNYYGDHQVHFAKATVSSEGPAGGVVAAGDLVGQPVYLLGSVDPITKQGPFFGAVMVDLDPTSGQTTQIYVGGLLIGSMDSPKLLIRHDTVCHSHSLGQRIVNGATDAPGSSTFNGTFQLTFPMKSVVSFDKSCATIAALMSDPKATGLVLRFSMFEMAPYLTTPELMAAYGSNQNPSNPSSGRVIGTIGPKYDGEPDTCPPGRMLINQPGKAPPAVGYAILNKGKSLLSIDMVSLMLKQNFRADRKAYTGPIEPNIDYGPIAITTGTDALGVSFDAQPADYFKFGGIVDIPLTEEQIEPVEKQPLTLTGSKGGNAVRIVEQPLRIYGNARNIYLDDLPDQHGVIALIVSWLGGPLKTDTTFAITSSAPGILPNGDFLNFPASVSARAGRSMISFPVSNKGSGFGFEALTVSAGNASFFVNFRKYLKTDFGIPAGSKITWEQAYECSLRFYYVTFPAMSLRIPLDDQGSIMATGDQIRARLSPVFHDTTLRMPVTRSLSPSQTHLLDSFLSGTPWQPL